jgi:hypothetical protein
MQIMTDETKSNNDRVYVVFADAIVTVEAVAATITNVFAGVDESG